MTEYQVQTSFIKWMKENYPDLTIYHIPNGEKRDVKTGVKLKNLGVLPGVFDLYCMDLKLYIEIKTDNGKLSDDQKWFSSKAKDTGHDIIIGFGLEDVCRKFEDFVKPKFNGISIAFDYNTGEYEVSAID